MKLLGVYLDSRYKFIGCLNKWVVSGGGVDGVVDAWDVVYDMISETNYSSKEFVF